MAQRMNAFVFFSTQMWRSGCLRPEILSSLRHDMLAGMAATMKLLYIVAIDGIHIIWPPRRVEVVSDSGSDMSDEEDELHAQEMRGREE